MNDATDYAEEPTPSVRVSEQRHRAHRRNRPNVHVLLARSLANCPCSLLVKTDAHKVEIASHALECENKEISSK